ncbi:MAG: hypothetical protein ACTSYD_12305 [Candidatus Heimdallarchaeaceae archaeon]
MPSDETLETRLKELEKKLNYIILQINTLKNMLDNEGLGQLSKLLDVLDLPLKAYNKPISALQKSLSLKERIIQRHPQIKHDEISKTLIEILEREGSMNISQLTEAVRKERGKASRRIIRERVNKLIALGVIKEKEGYGRKVALK